MTARSVHEATPRRVLRSTGLCHPRLPPAPPRRDLGRPAHPGAERGVVAEAGAALRVPGARGLEAQEMLADAGDRFPECPLDLALLARQLVCVEMAHVAAVEPDLEPALGERAHEPAHGDAPAFE